MELGSSRLCPGEFLAWVPLWDHGFIKFQNKWNFVPWIGEQPYTEIMFWQFSNIIIYVMMVKKIPDYYLNVWLFPNPGDKFQNRWRTSYGKNLSRTFNKNLDLVPWNGEEPYTKMLIWYFPNNLNIYEYVGKLLEQHFSVCLYSNPGTKCLSCWNRLKPGSQRGT